TVQVRDMRRSRARGPIFGSFYSAVESGAAARERARWFGRLSEKKAQFGLGEVRLGHSVLHERGQNLSNHRWPRRSIVAPAPNLHFGDSEVFGRRGVAAEHHFEQEIMPAARQTTLKAR